MTGPETIGLADLASRLEARAGDRTLVALAGAPGSGKSTVAEMLRATLERAAPGSAAIVAMDGFHYDDAVLSARSLLARKGAPDTFDVGGLLHALGRLRRNEEAEIAVPVFDRRLEIARAGAGLIPRDVRHVIVEGNYLLLEASPWSALRPLFDVAVFVDASEATLRRRLAERWRILGLAAPEIERKVEANDLPNGRLVVAGSVRPDHVLRNDDRSDATT